MSPDYRVVVDPRRRWGTPYLRETDVSVAYVVELHQGGCDEETILNLCPELSSADVLAALEWYERHGDGGLRPKPPDPGNRHPRIVVCPSVNGGVPTVKGTRVTVDAVCSMFEQGHTAEEILTEYPVLTMEDVHDAIAYDAEVAGPTER